MDFFIVFGESISCIHKKNRLDFLKVTKKMSIFFFQNDSDLALRLSTSIFFSHLTSSSG